MTRLLALAAIVLAPAAPSHVIRASATMQHVGSLRLEQDPHASAARTAFGEPSSCRRIRLEDGAIVHWRSLGVRIILATLGAIPAGQEPCTWGGMPISVVDVTGRMWTTSLGLRVGDAVAKLRRLYPRAPYVARNGGEAFPGHAYWLVTKRTACVGVGCGPGRVTVPQLIAKVRGGRVVELVLPVFAQGE